MVKNKQEKLRSLYGQEQMLGFGGFIADTVWREVSKIYQEPVVMWLKNQNESGENFWHKVEEADNMYTRYQRYVRDVLNGDPESKRNKAVGEWLMKQAVKYSSMPVDGCEDFFWEKYSTAEALRMMVVHLTKWEAAILNLRYGMNDGKEKTIEEINAMPQFGYTKNQMDLIMRLIQYSLEGEFTEYADFEKWCRKLRSYSMPRSKYK